MSERRVEVSQEVHDRLLATVRRRHPRKSFGYLLGFDADAAAIDFILFESNIRNEPEWQPSFQAYGRYFVEHDDAGFVATPEESWRVQSEIWKRGLEQVAVFHTHQRHPANFSRIDYDLHTSRFPDLWHLVISMRNPLLPQMRAFRVAETEICEAQVQIIAARTTTAFGVSA